MAYILYGLTFLVLASITALFITRNRWRHLIPESNILTRPRFLYDRLPSSFTGDMDAGLSSSNVDLSANIESGDGRAGLDDAAKAEVLRIMKKRRMTFDQARKAYMEDRFKANGIGADGRPRDPKFVSFS